MAGSYLPTNANKKLYNGGSEWQDDIEGLAEYYSTFYREYDPVIGRFNGVDPMSESFESWTTYHYSYNNPVNFNDPMGDYANTTADMAREMRDNYNSWRDNTYGTDRERLGYYLDLMGIDQSGGGGGGIGITETDFLFSYQGLRMRQNDFGSGIKHGFNKFGDFGYRERFNNYGDEGEEVIVGTRWVSISFGGAGGSFESPFAISAEKGDVFFRRGIPKTMRPQLTSASCVPAILGWTSGLLSGDATKSIEEYIILYATKMFPESYKDGLDEKEIPLVINHFFDVGNFTSYKEAIDSHTPVFAVTLTEKTLSPHGVMIIGYNSKTGNLIYMDPLLGGRNSKPESLFFETIHYPLIRNK